MFVPADVKLPGGDKPHVQPEGDDSTGREGADGRRRTRGRRQGDREKDAGGVEVRVQRVGPVAAPARQAADLATTYHPWYDIVISKAGKQMACRSLGRVRSTWRFVFPPLGPELYDVLSIHVWYGSLVVNNYFWPRTSCQ
ncbi:uncharacterized protein LOC144922040 [Branchiostoma floridae x Branchiostoma belcheri]